MRGAGMSNNDVGKKAVEALELRREDRALCEVGWQYAVSRYNLVLDTSGLDEEQWKHQIPLTRTAANRTADSMVAPLLSNKERLFSYRDSADMKAEEVAVQQAASTFFHRVFIPNVNGELKYRQACLHGLLCYHGVAKVGFDERVEYEPVFNTVPSIDGGQVAVGNEPKEWKSISYKRLTWIPCNPNNVWYDTDDIFSTPKYVAWRYWVSTKELKAKVKAERGKWITDNIDGEYQKPSTLKSISVKDTPVAYIRGNQTRELAYSPDNGDNQEYAKRQKDKGLIQVIEHWGTLYDCEGEPILENEWMITTSDGKVLRKPEAIPFMDKEPPFIVGIPEPDLLGESYGLAHLAPYVEQDDAVNRIYGFCIDTAAMESNPPIEKNTDRIDDVYSGQMQNSKEKITRGKIYLKSGENPLFTRAPIASLSNGLLWLYQNAMQNFGMSGMSSIQMGLPSAKNREPWKAQQGQIQSGEMQLGNLASMMNLTFLRPLIAKVYTMFIQYADTILDDPGVERMFDEDAIETLRSMTADERYKMISHRWDIMPDGIPESQRREDRLATYEMLLEQVRRDPEMGAYINPEIVYRKLLLEIGADYNEFKPDPNDLAYWTRFFGARARQTGLENAQVQQQGQMAMAQTQQGQQGGGMPMPGAPMMPEGMAMPTGNSQGVM